MLETEHKCSWEVAVGVWEWDLHELHTLAACMRLGFRTLYSIQRGAAYALELIILIALQTTWVCKRDEFDDIESFVNELPPNDILSMYRCRPTAQYPLLSNPLPVTPFSPCQTTSCVREPIVPSYTLSLFHC